MGLLGEEFGDQPGTSGFRWVIDPIDGTKSFVRHMPLWATLVGLEYKGEQIGGVAYIPVFGMTYRALRGGGAFMNERPIRVSDCAIGSRTRCSAIPASAGSPASAARRRSWNWPPARLGSAATATSTASSWWPRAPRI